MFWRRLATKHIELSYQGSQERIRNVINIEYLKPFRPSDKFPTRPTPPSDTQEDMLEYIVEEIRAHKRGKNQLFLLTKWLGFQHPTLEPLANFLDEDNVVSNVIVRDYMVEHALLADTL